MAVQYMRRVIQKKAKFDIMDLNVVQVCDYWTHAFFLWANCLVSYFNLLSFCQLNMKKLG